MTIEIKQVALCKKPKHVWKGGVSPIHPEPARCEVPLGFFHEQWHQWHDRFQVDVPPPRNRKWRSIGIPYYTYVYIYIHYDNESDPVFLVVFQQKADSHSKSPPAMFSMEGVKPGSCRLRVTPRETGGGFRHVYLVLLKPTVTLYLPRSEKRSAHNLLQLWKKCMEDIVKPCMKCFLAGAILV